MKTITNTNYWLLTLGSYQVGSGLDFVSIAFDLVSMTIDYYLSSEDQERQQLLIVQRSPYTDYIIYSNTLRRPFLQKHANA